MNDPVKERRDRRIRRTMLTSLKIALGTSPLKGLTGRTIRDTVDSAIESTDHTENDEHALRLLREMVSKGYFEERDIRTRKTQLFGLNFLFYSITSKGVDLWAEAIDPDPLVEDERI